MQPFGEKGKTKRTTEFKLEEKRKPQPEASPYSPAEAAGSRVSLNVGDRRMTDEEQIQTAKPLTAGGLLLRVIGFTLAILLVTAVLIAAIFFIGSMWTLKHGTLAD